MSFTLTNYWWLLIWLFGVGVFLNMKVPKEPLRVVGKIEYRWTILATILLAFPYALWAGFRGHFADTNAYRIMFTEAPSNLSELVSYASGVEKDKGFSILMVLMKSVIGNSDVLFFLIIAFFQMFCLMFVFRKYSSSLWISLFLFITSANYLSWMFNGMRQFIAVCICFLATGFVLKKKYIQACIMVLFASTLHGTAIIMIPVFYIAQGQAWNKKTLFFSLLAILAVFYVGSFTDILNEVLSETQYSDVMSTDIWMEDDGTNAIRVLVNAIPAILSFLGRKQIQQEADPVINMCTNMSIIGTGIYLISMVTSGIFVGRLPIYMILYSYILLPWEMDNLFTKDSKKLAYPLMLCGYLGFFYYQMHFAFSLL